MKKMIAIAALALLAPAAFAAQPVSTLGASNPAAALSLAPAARTGAPAGKKSKLVGTPLILALVAAAAVAGGVAAATSGGHHHSDSN